MNYIHSFLLGLLMHLQEIKLKKLATTDKIVHISEATEQDSDNIYLAGL